MTESEYVAVENLVRIRQVYSTIGEIMIVDDPETTQRLQHIAREVGALREQFSQAVGDLTTVDPTEEAHPRLTGDSKP